MPYSIPCHRIIDHDFDAVNSYPGVGISISENQTSGSDFGKRTASTAVSTARLLDRPGKDGAEVITANGQVVVSEKHDAVSFDRAGWLRTAAWVAARAALSSFSIASAFHSRAGPSLFRSKIMAAPDVGHPANRGFLNGEPADYHRRPRSGPTPVSALDQRS
jgi:hypothetical protein